MNESLAASIRERYLHTLARIADAACRSRAQAGSCAPGGGQ